jgi:hypothetical protein
LQVVHAAEVHLSPGVVELQDVLAVVLVHLLADGTPEGYLSVVVDGREVGDVAARDGDGDERRDDGADAAARKLLLPVDARLRARAVVVVKPARDA